MAGATLVLSGTVHSFEPLFDTRIDYGAGDGPWSVSSADLDGDNDIDLAMANQEKRQSNYHAIRRGIL